MSAIYIKAVDFAARAHALQTRKNSAKTPYVNHVIGVSYLLSSIGGITDENVLIAALLHDTVEDTAISIEDIEREFGTHIAVIVAEVTDDKSLPKAERKRLQIVNAPHKSPEAKLVKLADKLYNLRDMVAETPQGWGAARVQGYFVWAHAVIAGLRGTNASLEAALDDLFDNAVLVKSWTTSTIVNETVPAYPKGCDLSQFLYDYLQEMGGVAN